MDGLKGEMEVAWFIEIKVYLAWPAAQELLGQAEFGKKERLILIMSKNFYFIPWLMKIRTKNDSLLKFKTIDSNIESNKYW